MKKLKKMLMAATLGLMLTVTANSQDIKNDRGTFTKPKEGDITVESQFAPNLTGTTIFSLNEPILQNLFNGLNRDAVGGTDVGNTTATFPLLRFRKFKSTTFAWRALFNLSYSKNTQRGEVNDSTDYKRTNGELGFGAGFGFEKHLIGAERLSTYIGTDAQIAYGQYTYREVYDETAKHGQSGFAFGLRGFTGMDYYIMPKIYLGVEIGYGFSLNTYGIVRHSGTDPVTGGDLENETDRSSNMLFTPFISPSFRFGWRF
jgi:hypothetical protein